jgi:hypothetical protein
VTGGLAVPSGDPAQLDTLADQLQALGTQTADLGADTLKAAASTLAESDWTGQAAGSFAEFAVDLGGGIGSAEPVLNTIVEAAQRFSTALSDAQQKVQAYNSLAQAAENDPSGSLLGDAELAGQNATDSLQALQEAGNQAAATVTSAAGDLENLFKGPVGSWINSLDMPPGGIFGNPGDPLLPGLGETEIYPLPPDLGLTQGDPVAPDLGLTQGDPIPPDLGLTQGDPVPPEIGIGSEIYPLPPELGLDERYPIGPLGPLINPDSGGSGSGGEGVPKAPKSGYGKSAVPSWVINQGETPYQGETPTQTATRIMNAQYGQGNWNKGPGSEYNQILKWASRHF